MRLAQFLSSSSKTFYDVLNVPRNASKRDIKTSFINLSKQYHPDALSSSHAKGCPTKGSFIEINEAYSTLIDSASRRQYDHKLVVIENYTRPHSSSYAGSKGRYGHHNVGLGFDARESSNYYNNSDPSQRDYDFSRSTEFSQRRGSNHKRVIAYLIVMMVFATGVHSFRIHWAHQGYQKHSLDESQRNQVIYDNVREKAKTLTVQQQLAILSARHSQVVEDHSDTTSVEK